jgi:hypothetical protein
MVKTFEEMDLIGNLKQDKPLKSGCFRLQRRLFGLEVNVQISELTLQNHKMKLLTPLPTYFRIF